jgi:hypothetical protein
VRNDFQNGFIKEKTCKEFLLGLLIQQILEKLYNKALSSERIISENVHNRFKFSKSTLTNVWHYGPDKHKMFVNILGNVINIEINLGHGVRR